MSVIAEYGFQSPKLALAATGEAVPDAVWRLERAYATNPQQPILFLWASAPSLEELERAFESDPTVGRFETLGEDGDSRLYRIETTDELGVVLYPAWVDLGGERLHSHYRDGWWNARVRFPNRDAFSAYREFLDEHDVSFKLRRVYDSTRPNELAPALTDEQRETLKLAYELGYFDVPRSATTADLAEVLDVSNQAISERLRRGYARLVEETMT